MSVLTAVTGAFPRWEMVRRQRLYWVTVYKRTWKGSAVTSFVMPLFYVL
jgi:lipooligosaccharide transport system permease protein